MSTETITKRRMMAELIFQNSNDTTIATGSLADLGFTTRVLDWADPEGGPHVWMLAFIDYDGGQEQFFHWIHNLAIELDGDMIEAGYSGSDADVEAWIAEKS